MPIHVFRGRAEQPAGPTKDTARSALREGEHAFFTGRVEASHFVACGDHGGNLLRSRRQPWAGSENLLSEPLDFGLAAPYNRVVRPPDNACCTMRNAFSGGLCALKGRRTGHDGLWSILA
jgi:hypothetical protein